MKWSERIDNLFRSASSPRESGLRDAMVAGRTAKLAENYELALMQFDHALEIARGSDVSVVTSISLHRAEALIRLRRWDDALTFIDASRVSVPAAMRSLHNTYLDCALGMLEQARGDVDAARAAYDSALKSARAGNHAAFAGAEGRAMGHLADLYLRDGNASYAAHLLKDALSKLGSSNDLELSAYFVGLLGQAMTENGQNADGLHFIQRALMLAEQFHHRLYQRHWGLVLGERALEEARYLDARAHYQRVMHLFDTDVPIPAFIALHIGLSKASVFLRDYQVAIEYAQTAYDGASRMIDPPLDPPIAIIDPVQAPTLARSALGLALRAAGRSDQALPHLRALVDTIPAGKPTREQIDILRGFGAALSDSGDAEGAIAVYQRALTAAAQLDDALEIALTHRDLGLIYQRADQPTQAIHEWTQALAINEKNNAYAQIARLYCDLGGARRAINGLNARALRDYEQALMALNKVDPNDLETRGLVLSNAANVYAETGDTDSADAFFSEAITIAERTGDTAAEALRNGNYGWFLVVIGRPRRAIATLERALRLSETLQLRLQAAVQTDNIGLAHDSLAEYPAAREFHEKALSRLEPSDAPYWKHSFTLNLANTLLSLNEYEQAGELLDAVLSDDAARMDADLYTRALTTHARAALLRQHITAAAEPLEQAILLARKHDFKRLLADLLFLRSQQQAALSAAAPARAAWDEAVRLYTLLHMPQAKIQPAWLSA